MDEDAQLVYSLLGVNDTILSTNTRNVHSSTKHDTKSVLAPFRDLSDENLRRLIKRYELDMALLGYQFNPDTLEATCAIKTDAGDYCC